MSGNSRAPSSAAGSIFLASQCAAALSRTAARAVRNWTKIGTEILYIETVMKLPRLLLRPRRRRHALQRARPNAPGRILAASPRHVLPAYRLGPVVQPGGKSTAIVDKYRRTA